LTTESLNMRAFAVLALVVAASATIHFKEEFGSDWESRWVQSKAKADLGTFVRSRGKYYGDAEADYGIQTSQDARFYSISSKISPAFSNKDKTVVIQFTVKHEQNIDCGGGYLKIFPESVALDKFDGDSEYNIMFGPDICGSGTRKVHVILNYKGKNHLITKTINPMSDEATHLYTLVLNPDQTYEVHIDGEKKESGTLEADFEFLPPKKIPDPAATKPSQDEWDERPRIDDPADVKPEDWDSIPEQIADPDAEKPSDWDDDMDGDWEAPKIKNPEYKGEWKAKTIENPAYKGRWVHPEIDNPEYVEDKSIYAFSSFGGVGIDVWQVKSGSIFDNILITDSVEEAEAHAKATFHKNIAAEKEMKRVEDEKSAKAAADAAAAATPETEDDDEDDGEENAKEEL